MLTYFSLLSTWNLFSLPFIGKLQGNLGDCYMYAQMFDEVGNTEDSQSVEKTLLQISELSWMEGKTSDPRDLELDCLVNLHISTLEEVNIRPGRTGGENDLRLESGLRVALCTGAFQQSAWLPHLHISVRSSFQTVILAFVWHDYSVVNIVIITLEESFSFLDWLSRASETGLTVIYLTLHADFQLCMCIEYLCHSSGFRVTHLFNWNFFSTTRLHAYDFHDKPQP